MVEMEGESPARTQAVLHEAFPDLFNPYAAASSAVSATFYEEVRALSISSGVDAALTLDAVEAPRWHGLVGWGAGASMFERGGQALVFSLLSGGLTRALREAASDTIIGNAQMERVQVGYQRVPSPGCCAWCGMIASRGDIHKSEDDALRVMGRGVPVGQGRGRGSKGKGRGIRPRGSRAIGEKYHDHCKCAGVPVFEDNYVQMQDDAESYYDAYGAARDRVAAKRKAEGYQGFGDQKTSTKMILAEMRQSLGVK